MMSEFVEFPVLLDFLFFGRFSARIQLFLRRSISISSRSDFEIHVKSRNARRKVNFHVKQPVDRASGKFLRIFLQGDAGYSRDILATRYLSGQNESE